MYCKKFWRQALCTTYSRCFHSVQLRLDCCLQIAFEWSFSFVCRFLITESVEECFVTFPSEPLTIPNSGPFILYYAPNNSQGMYIAQSVHREKREEEINLWTLHCFISSRRLLHFEKVQCCLLPGIFGGFCQVY